MLISWIDSSDGAASRVSLVLTFTFEAPSSSQFTELHRLPLMLVDSVPPRSSGAQKQVFS